MLDYVIDGCAIYLAYATLTLILWAYSGKPRRVKVEPNQERATQTDQA